MNGLLLGFLVAMGAGFGATALNDADAKEGIRAVLIQGAQDLGCDFGPSGACSNWNTS